MAATSTIPIAFVIGGDPVELGLAATYSRPGANATGISILTATLEPKRLELLRELVPQVSMEIRRRSDVPPLTAALPPKPEVHPRSCHVANVP
jgi:ABC transporter substrate binding protein